MSIPRSLVRALVALPVAGLLALALSCDATPVLAPSSAVRAPLHPARSVATGEVTHFYVQAFVEDWELFMADRLPASLAAASEVVFVFTDAGDGGHGMDYVEMRERANVASLDRLLGSTAPWSCAVATVRTHPIRRCTKGQVVAYYMRLPDGAPTGEGYGDRGSLAMLRDGRQATMTAFDGTTSYSSWADVVFTVRAIVNDESAGQGAPYTVVNTIEFDRTLNYRDHVDRLATADIANAARAGQNWDVNLFVGLPAQNLAANLTQEQHDFKADIYNEYDAVVGAAGYGHPKWDGDVQAMMWRTYSRVAPVSLTDVYVVGHQDDWQLFAGEAVNGSLQTAGKVVLVYTTAGDANMGTYYWHLRETASENSVAALLPHGGDWTCANRPVNAHTLWRCERGNVVAYYMRLPDGAPSGEGFDGRPGLTQLRDGSVGSLPTMDGVNTYSSWSDLVATFGAIVDIETTHGSGPAVTVSAPDYDRSLNSADHADHWATGDLVRAAAEAHAWSMNWFVGYDIQNRVVDLTQQQHDVKEAAFYAADSTMGAAGNGYTRYEGDYQAWLWRSYIRPVAP